MQFGHDELATPGLEALGPGVARSVKRGDFAAGGRNFGPGSSRAQAPEALKHLGVSALIAESFAGLFYRNAINLGLPALVCAQAKRIRPGDELRIDFASGKISDLTSGATLSAEPLPAFLMQIVNDGGLLPHLEKRLRTTS